MWFPVLLRTRSSCAQPEQNMLPHTFLTGLERRGELKKREVKEKGKETGVWLAKEKERVREEETQALFLMPFLPWQHYKFTVKAL